MNKLSTEQIKSIKICGKFLRESLEITASAVAAGVSTAELDRIAKKELIARGCIPSFLNYFVPGAGYYPNSLCVSINEEIVHGIPSENRILEEGDIVSLDLGAGYNGIYTDMAVTVPVGKVSGKASKLIEITEQSLAKGIAQAVAKNTIGDIGNSIEAFAKSNNLGVIRDYVGHGIGTKPHMPPQIPNFGAKGSGEPICEGMALAIEPMLSLGGFQTEIDDNGWTVRTSDHSLSAHFEHTIIIENGKPVVVTR